MKIGKYDISKKNMIIIGVIILVFVIGVILLTKKDGKIFYNLDASIKIVKSEASQIEFEDYKTNEFSIKKPKGWKVDTLGDYIHYTIKVYDPNNPTYQFFLNMKTEGYNKSEDAKRWQQKYYPNDMFAKTSVIATKDTEGFYKIFNDLGTLNNTAAFTFPTLTDFTVSENLGKGSLGGDILRATFKDTNGEEGEGIFTAYVYDVGTYYVYENIISGKQIDIQYLNVYDNNKNKLDKKIVRGDKLSNDEHILVAVIFIKNKDNKYLIQKTSLEKSGLYSTTGGHVLYNEDSKTSIIREVKEELGIDIANDDIKYIGSILFGVPFGDIYYLEKDIDIDSVKLQKEEVSSVSYMTKEEIDDLIKKEKITKSHGLMFKYLCKKIIK